MMHQLRQERLARERKEQHRALGAGGPPTQQAQQQQPPRQVSRWGAGGGGGGGGEHDRQLAMNEAVSRGGEETSGEVRARFMALTGQVVGLKPRARLSQPRK